MQTSTISSLLLIPGQSVNYLFSGKEKWQPGCQSSSLNHHIFDFAFKCFGLFLDSLRVELLWRGKIGIWGILWSLGLSSNWLPRNIYHWCSSPTWEVPWYLRHVLIIFSTYTFECDKYFGETTMREIKGIKLDILIWCQSFQFLRQ